MKDFDKKFNDATKAIDPKYFSVQRWNGDVVYRERVYTYELFHQLRSVWFDDDEQNEFVLHGELDKRGHYALQELGVEGSKPDLLIHLPGSMERNFAIIEVKPSRARSSGILKDLETLTTFIRHVMYGRAIYLLYGGGCDDAIKRVKDLSAQVENLALIELWRHEKPGEAATLVCLIGSA